MMNLFYSKVSSISKRLVRVSSCRKIMSCLGFAFLHCFLISACAYRLGSPERKLPEGLKVVSIPIFKNKTPEPSIEVMFTNALIQEFSRSRLAAVKNTASVEKLVPGGTSTTASDVEAEILGEVIYLAIKGAPPRADAGLPTGSVLTPVYQINMTTNIKLVRRSDKKVLWEGNFDGERTYVAPQVTAAGINTVNPLYNLSARRQNIELMSFDMMAEAHDRITENF